MLNRKNFTKIFIVALLILATIAVQAAPVFAYDRRGGGRRPDFHYTPHYKPHGRVVHSLPYAYTRLFMAGIEYFYWEGMYYRRMSNRYVIVPAPVGTVVTTIPSGCRPVVIDGVPYYNINDVTYMQTSYGYQVVPEPKIIVIKDSEIKAAAKESVQNELNAQRAASVSAASTANNNGESFTVNIPNSSGGYTPVVLRRSGTGFVGPQGEFYTEFPQIEQLKVMYAK